MVILNEKFDVGLLNKEREKYHNFSKRIAQVVEDLFKADINYYATKVIPFKSGCVNVYFKLEFKRIVRASIIISTLKYAAMDGKFGSFVVDPSSITVLQDETPASSSKKSTGEKGSLLVVFFFLLVVFVLIYFVCRSKKQSRTTSSVVPGSGGRTASSVVPASKAGQSTGGTRPFQDVYQLSRVKADRTKEEERVFR
ncbi:uncharacterized protein LOC111344369, partial [Stylophora pistillata]|uniref:uncharacterized protein LOC111344369 n=1 Tax=Stylophora pistillata TaxID=50429 RepID=UPI000C049925